MSEPVPALSPVERAIVIAIREALRLRREEHGKLTVVTPKRGREAA